MKYAWCSILVVASNVFVASQASATPTFEMRVQSAGFNSGTIAGTVDPGGLSGSVAAAGLVVSGTGGNSFTIGALNGGFDLTPTLMMDLVGSAITHTSDAAGAVRIYLSLAGLDDPQTPLLFRDEFSGSLASTQLGTRSRAKLFLGNKSFSTKVQLLDTGLIRSGDAGPDCSLPTDTSFACDTHKWASVPSDPYSLTQLVVLKFAKHTENLSEDFEARASDPVPEPGSLALLASGMFAAAAFGLRRSKRLRGA